jgi:hypothetical protein
VLVLRTWAAALEGIDQNENAQQIEIYFSGGRGGGPDGVVPVHHGVCPQ